MNQTDAFRKYVEKIEKTSDVGHCYYTVAKNLLKVMDSSDNKNWTIDDLEIYVSQNKAKKEKQVETLLNFYKYCKDSFNITIESDFYNKIVIDDPIQRRIAVVKYMQNHTNTTSEIAEVFMLDDRTMRTDLRALEDGISVFDQELNFDINHQKWKHSMVYSNHPIVLNLDMAEVVAMIVGLIEAASKDRLFAPQFENIAKNVYSNLTDYAKGKISHLMKEKNLSFNDFEIDEYERSISNSLITMWKAECPGTIQVCRDGIDYVYTKCKVIDYVDDTIVITTQNGKTINLPLSDIFCVEYELNREYV